MFFHGVLSLEQVVLVCKCTALWFHKKYLFHTLWHVPDQPAKTKQNIFSQLYQLALKQKLKLLTTAFYCFILSLCFLKFYILQVYNYLVILFYISGCSSPVPHSLVQEIWNLNYLDNCAMQTFADWCIFSSFSLLINGVVILKLFLGILA